LFCVLRWFFFHFFVVIMCVRLNYSFWFRS
jgi:hypothetical protein